MIGTGARRRDRVRRLAGVASAGFRARPAISRGTRHRSRSHPRRVALHAAALHLAPSVDPGLDGSCPITYPVKGKLASGIYHLPGSGHYERTRPDRCYKDPAAAEADGLRAAKR